jgi:glutaredoxin
MANAEFPDVEIYTTPTCPDCRQLKAWLTSKGVPFTERDLADPAVAEEAKARTGVRVAPITVIGANVSYGTFASQRPTLADLLSLPRGA